MRHPGHKHESDEQKKSGGNWGERTKEARRERGHKEGERARAVPNESLFCCPAHLSTNHSGASPRKSTCGEGRRENAARQDERSEKETEHTKPNKQKTKRNQMRGTRRGGEREEGGGEGRESGERHHHLPEHPT